MGGLSLLEMTMRSQPRALSQVKETMSS